MSETTHITYKQCEMRHPETGMVDVAWIPNRFAQKGKSLRLRGTPGWVVSDVYAGTSLNIVELILRRDVHKRFVDVLGG